MKRKFLSTLLLFILAISLAVGTAVVSHAASKSGISISLAKNITANVTVADVDGAPKSATVYLKSGGNTVKTFNDVAVSTSGTTATLAVEIAVKDIDKTVLVDFNGSEKTYEFTVKSYLQSLASTGTEAERAVASALLAYGESARAYFAGEAVDAVSGSISYDKEYSASSPISGLTHYSVSLLLESEMTIRHYFKVSGDVKNYTFFVDYDLDGGYDENEKLTAVEKLDEGGSYNYYVDISGIKPNDIDRQFTVYVTNGSSTYSCSYSAMNWAKRTFDKADSSNASRALALGLAGYLNGAAEMKANINYYVNGTLEKSVPYQYGVENYLAYAPEKIGYVFAGWFSDSALTRPAAGLIPADETEDINVYAKFVKLDTHEVFAAGKIHELMTSDQVHGAQFDGTDTNLTYTVKNGYTTYTNTNGSNGPDDTDYAGFKVNSANGYGSTTREQIDSTPTGTRHFMLTIELGKVAGHNVLPFGLTTGWNMGGNPLLFVTGKDNYVYFGQVDEEHRIAELKEDGVAPITIYIDFNTNTQWPVYSATNLAGDTVSKTIGTNLIDNASYMLVFVGKQAVNSASSIFSLPTTNASLNIGNISLDAIPDEEPEHDPMHIITDGMGDIIMEYNAFEATRLPDTYTGDGVFVGWYADAGFTKSINSITAGCSGTVTVYPKFEQAVPDEDAEIVASIKEQLSAFRGTDFGNRTTLNASELSVQPNTSHPRVYVNEATLVDVKANLTHTDNASHYSALISSANTSLNKTYDTFPTAVNSLKAYFGEAENLAFAYLTTGKAKYGYKAIWYILNYIDQIKKAPSIAMTAHDASTVIHVTGEVYDWCYPLLSDEHKSQIINGTCLVTAAHSADTYGYPPTTTEIIAGHGAERLVMRDWLAFAVAVADEAPDIYNYIAGKVVNEYTKMPNWYYVSNDVHQGTAYGTVARLYPNIAADMIMYSATGERIFSEDIDFAEVIMSSIYKMRPDGESLRIGDDFNQTGASYATGVIAYMAYFAGNYYGNATAKAWYKHLGSPVETLYASEFTRAMYLITNDPSVVVEDGDLYNLELVRYNGSPAGSMIARSAWGDKNAWMTYTNIEEAGANNHDHKDSGTFQIYYKGILAPNAGQYEHNHQNYNSAIHINYTKQTISKNGLLIYNPNLEELYGQWANSGGQRVDTAADVSTPSSFEGYLTSNLANQAKVLGHDSAVDGDGEFVYAYISGDITNSYNSSTVDLVMRSTMTLATGDPDHPMAFIVYDRITSDDASYKKSFVLHTMEKPTFNGGSEVSAPAGEDAAFTYISGSNSFYYTNVLGPTGAYLQDKPNDKYNGKLTTTTLLPENPVYRYIGGDGKRFWVNGVNGGNSDVTENPTLHPVGEIGWGRVEVSPSVEQLTDSFLNVMYVSDAKDAQGNYTSNALAPSSLVQCDTHEGAVTFGNVVMFSKTNESVSSVIRFTADGTGEMNYYVGGLSSGKWFVKVGDGAATEHMVDAASGLLTFTANAGEEITLTPADLTFRLNYELTGGNINDTEYTTTFKADSTITLPTNVTKANCVFYGLYMDSAFTTKATPELIKAKSSNVTVYARFVSSSLVALDGQAINNRFTGNEFKGKENAESGMSYINNGDGSVTYKYFSEQPLTGGYGFFNTFDGSTLATNLASHPGEKKLYELSIEIGLVEGYNVLPFAFNGYNGWNLLVPGTPHSDGKYYVYLQNTSAAKRIAELPSDGSLVTVTMYVDLSVNGIATYSAYNISDQLQTYQSNFTGQGEAQLGRVLIGQQVTKTTSAYKPTSYPAAIRLGKFFMKPILEIPSAT